MNIYQSIIFADLFLMLLNCNQGNTDSVCGFDPNSPRLLTAEKMIPPPLPVMQLVQVRKIHDKSSLLVAVSPKHAKTALCFVSLNHGSKWRQVKPDINAVFTNIPLRHGPDLLMIASTPRPVAQYEFNANSNCIDSVSKDNGKSWDKVKSNWVSSGPISKCLPNGIYGHNGERIYVYVYDNQSKGIWVSDDYGHNFRFLTSEVFYLVESLADSKTMYGVGNEMLKVSHDGGRNWEKLESSRFILKPVFQGSNGQLQTWDAEGLGNEAAYPDPLEQIQTDPQNINIFYVLTRKGIFRSTDGGKSYILLRLKTDKYMGIDRMAVDPVNGRYVYSQCNMNSLYRSDDYGCTWTKLEVPLR
jgi:hypothetical protein